MIEPIKREQILETSVIPNFPYFVLRNEIVSGYNCYAKEMLEIKGYYYDYELGAKFYTEGSNGDYVPSQIHFKNIKTLIDKQARFMFSQSPDIVIQQIGTDKKDKEKVEQYQKLVNAVLQDKNNNFYSNLLKSAKDCFIGKRIACLIDYSEDYGIQVHFYNSLQFYYEMEYGTRKLSKFVSFENVNESETNGDSIYLVNRYELINSKAHMSSVLYSGTGTPLDILIDEQETELTYIPAVIIFNEGTLDDRKGVSDVKYMNDYESSYNLIGNSDVDSLRKNMNPVNYTVDMNPRTTQDLPTSPGAYWDLQHNQNMNDPKPSVGKLSPDLQHSEPLKTTLDRLKSAMYDSVNVPDISQDGLLGGITSFKALRALYYPLEIRSDEKMKIWRPSIMAIVETIIDLAKLNKNAVIGRYVLTGLDDVQYNIEIEENYALLDDETEEKTTDLSEIAQSTRSRKSYIKKWRKSEFKTEEQIEEELMQIAIENNMFDTLSMNTNVQRTLNDDETKQTIEKNIEDIKTE